MFEILGGLEGGVWKEGRGKEEEWGRGEEKQAGKGLRGRRNGSGRRGFAREWRS